MSERRVTTEIAMAELAHLVANAGGNPGMLNTPSGVTTYFERDEVISLGREIQAARRSNGVASEPVTRYFDKVGEVIAGSRATVVVRTGPGLGATSMYFMAGGPCVTIDIADGRCELSLHGSVPPIRLADEAETSELPTVVGRFMTDGPRAFVAMWRGRVAYSDDGRAWRKAPPGDNRAAPTILQHFIFG